MSVSAAYPVVEASQAGQVRRAAQGRAAQLGFSEERAGRVALVASELATNLAKHARGGEVLVRTLTGPAGEDDGLEILALDRGPGMPDVALSRRDGHSTAGTLGHGLGAVYRQADDVDLYTDRRGSVIAARVWRAPPGPDGPALPFDIGAVSVPKPGETACGDAWAWRLLGRHLALLVADGLGHGAAAREAADRAVAAFTGAPARPALEILTGVHAALRGTRGAAVGVLVAALDERIVTCAGLGNIASVLVSGAPSARQTLPSHNGTAGYTAARLQEFSYPLPPGATIVMASDGLRSSWDLGAYPGLLSRSGSVLAGVLYRDFSRGRDDVTVVAAMERTGSAEKL